MVTDSEKDAIQPVILSASRRTDMPRFYLDILMEQLRKRSFSWHNPYTGQLRSFSLSPGQQAVVVLWSKDFGPFLKNKAAFADWPLFFHFTVNTSDPLLEPGIPALDERIGQMQVLTKEWGTKAVRWRFDPIAVWRSDTGLKTNIDGLHDIADAFHRLGIRDVTVSFMDHYRKIDRRAGAHIPPVEFVYPDHEEQAAMVSDHFRRLSERGFVIHTCCEPALAEAGLPGVRPGACIDAELLSEVSGLDLNAIPDRGQRRSKGCLCHKSIDIGCYTHHRCKANCLYCYARP